MKKQFLLLLLCLFSLLGGVKAETKTGSCGEAAFWSLDDEGTLKVWGSGEMSNYSANTVPWKDCRSKIKNIIIGEGITQIGSYAFSNCEKIETVSLPQSLEVINTCAFYTPTDNKGTIILPPNISFIGIDALCWKDIKAEFGRTVIELWRAGYDNAVDAKTGTSLSKSTLCPLSLSYDETKYTVKIKAKGKPDDRLTCTLNGTEITSNETVVTETALPGTKVDAVIKAKIKGDDKIHECKVMSGYAYTSGYAPTVDATATATSLSIEYSHPDVDTKYAKVYRKEFYVYQGTKQIKHIEGKDNGKIKLSGLDPNSNFTVKYLVQLSAKGHYEYKEYTTTKNISTEKLLLVTQQPKVISVGNVIIAAESNVADDEQNVGFEWRRTDWSKDFASNTASACIYKGKIEGYIRNLNSTVLWKYRPYYLANSGTYYYGDWVGLDPSNTSYFEPTVHTYDEITIEGNTALVKGYALRGTDGIKVQGFKYWKKAGTSVHGMEKTNAPSNALTVEATGQVMTATLPDLAYNSDYEYQAFVTTDEGTYYGEVMTFSTGADPTGIKNVTTSSNHVSAGIYNVSGYKMQHLQKGFNIIVYKDGSRKKVYIK